MVIVSWQYWFPSVDGGEKDPYVIENQPISMPVFACDFGGMHRS